MQLSDNEIDLICDYMADEIAPHNLAMMILENASDRMKEAWLEEANKPSRTSEEAKEERAKNLADCLTRLTPDERINLSYALDDVTKALLIDDFIDYGGEGVYVGKHVYDHVINQAIDMPYSDTIEVIIDDRK